MRPLLPSRLLARRRGAAVFGYMVFVAGLAAAALLGVLLLWGGAGGRGGAAGVDGRAASAADGGLETARAPSWGGLEGLVGGGAFLILEGEGSGIDTQGGVSPGPRRILTLRNGGDAASPPLSGLIVLEGPGAGSFTATPIGCGALAPRAACSVEIRPVRTENGVYAATLRVASRNEPTLALSGTASGFGPPLAWEGSGAGIDTVAPGPSPFRIVQLRNLSPSPVSAVVSAVGGPFRIAASTCGAPVAGGATCQVAVEAAPVADGPYAGTLSASAPGGSVSLPLSGAATGFVPALAWEGSGAGFAPVAPPSPALTAWRGLTLRNQGVVRTPSAPVFALSGPDAGSFEVDPAGCAVVLDLGDACTIQIRASRTANGPFAATLTASVGGVSADLPLSGTASGFAPFLAWEGPGVVPAITSPTGLPSLGAPATWRLRNAGTLETASLAGQVVLGGTAPGNFEIVRNTCAGPVAPGAFCEVDLRLVASASGTYQAILGVGAHNAPGTPVSGTASGFVAILAWSGPTTGYDILSPTATPFEGTPQPVVLTNVGWATSPDLTGSAVLAGARPDAFRIVSDGCARALPPGQSCTVQVAPRASDNLGEVSAQLVMQASNAPVHPLSGAIGGFVAFWAFDAEPSGAFSISNPPASPATQTRTFVLRNVGTLAGTVPSRTLSGANAADFSVSGGTCASQTLEPQATCTVEVTFTATADVAGRTATLAAGGASKALSGSAVGVPAACTPGSAVLSTVGVGTFARPAGTADCAFRVVLVGAGGGGFRGDGSGFAGSGGGSGEIVRLSFAPGQMPATVAYSIGAGAPGRTACGGSSTTTPRGGSTVFGTATALGGTSAGVSGCAPFFGAFAGTGGSSGGSRGQVGGAGGALMPGSGATTSQGTASVAAALDGLTQRTVSAGPGGLAGTSPQGGSASGGGGGGGILISGASPAAAATAGAAVGTGVQGGRPGGGFGAGGGGANTHQETGQIGTDPDTGEPIFGTVALSSGNGGTGASGGIYVEWSAP